MICSIGVSVFFVVSLFISERLTFFKSFCLFSLVAIASFIILKKDSEEYNYNIVLAGGCMIAFCSYLNYDIFLIITGHGYRHYMTYDDFVAGSIFVYVDILDYIVQILSC